MAKKQHMCTTVTIVVMAELPLI